MQRSRCIKFEMVLILAWNLAGSALGCGTQSWGGNPAPSDSPSEPSTARGVPSTLASSAHGPDGERAGSAGPAAEPDDFVEPYPRGRWRLASPDDLSRVMFWVSQVLIRHRDVQAGVVSFDLGDWTPAPPVPARTRREAFELADAIRAELVKSPADFRRVARERSEDVATSGRGGSLGGLSAFDFTSRHGTVLDALAALKPGEISRVVETPYGFHVFQRRQPPEQAVVSGSRIVIGYDQAPWLKVYLARRPVERSREQALELSRTVYERALAGESFAGLVEEYSDHTEALRAGDFGQWSTHERTPFPREVEALAELEVGEIAPPLDSPFGIQIIMRTPNGERPMYAMSTLQQNFEPLQPPSHPASRDAVMQNLARLALEVGGDSTRFDALQTSYCCEAVEQWQEGRGSAVAEQVLRGLAVGQVAAQSVALPAAFAILKRMPIHSEPTPPVVFDLPVPPVLDVRELARKGQVDYRLSSRKISAQIGLDGQAAERFIALHDAEMTKEAESEEQNLVRFDRLMTEVTALLGKQQYEAYQAALFAYCEQRLLAAYDRPWRKSRLR